jgi:predicted amidophosphoribosyltransferase
MRPWARFVESAFPTFCPGCGERASPVCPRCARGLRAAAPAAPPPGIDEWLAPFSYEGVARELVARMKYRQARATVPWLAAHMARLVVDAVPRGRLQVVTFAPTTPARRRERGVDHADLLGRAVAAGLRLPFRRLLRRLPGPPQTGRAAGERRAGPRFTARVALTGAAVLLVDDVATTGATVAAAAAALGAAGAAAIVVVTAARTPPPGLAREAPAYTRSMAAGPRAGGST